MRPDRVIDGSGWGIRPVVKQDFDFDQINWGNEEQKFRTELGKKSLKIV